MSKTARLMKDSGIEWIGEIPAGWTVNRLKYSADIDPSCNPFPIQKEDVITYTPMEFIKRGYYINNTALRGTLSDSLTIYKEGDIVIAKVTPCFENGNIAIMENLTSGFGMGSSELFVIRATKIVKRFLFYFLQNQAFISMGCSTMSGVAGLKRVSPNFIRNCPVPTPPLAEQERITGYLDEKCATIDAVIAGEEAVIERLREYKQSLITETVTKGLNPNATMKDSGIDWIGKIPAEWEIVKFKYVHNTSNVGNPIDKQYWSNDINDKNFYTAQAEPIKTTFKDFPPQKYTKSNDLLLARNGTPYVYIPFDNSIYSDHIIRVDIKPNFNRRFIHYALQSSIKKENITGVSILTWSVSIWDRQILPSPSLTEQTRIAAYLDEKCTAIDSNIESRQSLIEKLTTYKKSLIYEVVTGKKEV